MEPERKIEKWLKAYAKKRRTETGEPFNLHPAARRLLQNEVARDKPKADDDDESVSLWEVIRQQWALLLSFAACIFLVGIIILPVTYHAAKNKTRSFAAASGAKEVDSGVNAPAVASSGQVAASLEDKKDMTLARNELGDREINPGSKDEVPKATVNRDTLYATNGAASPTVAMAVTPSAAPEVSHSIGVTPLEVSPGSSPMLPTTPPLVAAAAPSVNVSPGQPVAGETAPAAVPPVEMPSSEQNAGAFSYQQKSESEMGPAASRRLGELQNVFKNSIGPSQANAVLSNFQVQQNGNAIRLVDQDGSVYNGWLQLADRQAEKIENQAESTDNRLAQNAMTVAAGLPSQQIAAAQDALQIAQNYFFHVYGTNRTTKQTVSFTGSLGANIVPTNSANLSFGLTDNLANSDGGGFGGGGTAGSAFDRAKLEATNQVAQLPWADLRITGTAVLSQTNRIPVNAAPVAPNKN
jgi:hypothetical protein